MYLEKIYNFAKNILFPINRSLTGAGTRKTLFLIKKHISDLKIKKFRCRSKVFDWQIPSEWNVSDAFVLDKNNNKIVDFKKNNLHLVSYSIPVNKIITKKELLKKMYTLKKQPNAIPYITSYYKKSWGFCISENNKKKINNEYDNNDKFKVVIKSKFNMKGYMNYGEVVLRGKSKEEILISTYICHPSMANNELSGPIVSILLIDYFKKIKLKKTLRFIFIPETIGSIAYIFYNFKKTKK